jgi:hypothetical protein
MPFARWAFDGMNGAKRLSLTVWRSLTSARLLVLLVTSLLVALVIASLFPRFPPDSANRAPWLQSAALRYRQTTGLIQLHDFSEAFPAPWFLVLVAGLLLNLETCAAQRPLRRWRALARRLATAHGEEFYRSHVGRQEWPVSSLQEALEAAKVALRTSPCRTVCTPSMMHRPSEPIASRCGAVGARQARW